MRSLFALKTESILLLLIATFICGCGADRNSPSTEAMPRTVANPTGELPPTEGTETYAHVIENGILPVVDHPLSTFSIDTDTASYSNIRRFLLQGQLPPSDAVRIEECLNYFTYDYPPPDGDAPFSIHAEVAGCPWNPAHRLAKLGIQGRTVSNEQRPAANLVFLLDVSGSMNHPKKLPLLKESMRLLVEQLGESDHIAIVVYAGAAGMVLPSTSASQAKKIGDAIDQLQAGGSTNGAIGITLAYQIAVENMAPNGINRVILCTDGDFNVGITDRTQLTSLIEDKAKSGVFLSVLGFGMGNIKDDTMEGLADRGNGNYAYIDSFNEAKKVLVDQVSGTLITIAKDVKIQVHFNPAQVAGYRLIGYDNRRLTNRDFADDTKDAGEIGAGHSVTALYEIVPANAPTPDAEAVTNQPSIARNAGNELFTVKLRYKQPNDQSSQESQFAVTDRGTSFNEASSDFRFASAVTQFAMLLKNSAHRGQATFESTLELKDSARNDPKGYRTEFFELVRQARGLRNNSAPRISVPAD
jgi:Ca-activated chloride channel family protein